MRARLYNLVDDSSMAGVFVWYTYPFGVQLGLGVTRLAGHTFPPQKHVV